MYHLHKKVHSNGQLTASILYFLVSKKSLKIHRGLYIYPLNIEILTHKTKRVFQTLPHFYLAQFSYGCVTLHTSPWGLWSTPHLSHLEVSTSHITLRSLVRTSPQSPRVLYITHHLEVSRTVWLVAETQILEYRSVCVTHVLTHSSLPSQHC